MVAVTCVYADDKLIQESLKQISGIVNGKWTTRMLQRNAKTTTALVFVLQFVCQFDADSLIWSRTGD